MERGKNANQIAIVVSIPVEDLVAGCFFRRGSRSWTFLGGDPKYVNWFRGQGGGREKQKKKV